MPSPLLTRGERIGDGLNLQRWQTIRKIGEGQFAEVYEVADTFNDGRRVALKIDRTLEVKTVRQEQKVLKRLQACPTVVRLLEQGTHENRGFVVMEVRLWGSLQGRHLTTSHKTSKKSNSMLVSAPAKCPAASVVL
jgi:serine/threonine protein kinase